MNIAVSSLKTDSAANAVPPPAHLPTPVPHPLPGSAPAATILVIESNVQDINLLAIALAHTQLPVQIYPALNLTDAQSYLLGTGRFADRNLFPEPYLIITNSRFPTGSVSEFITWLRHHPTLQSLPIIVHSSHDTPEQRGELYQHGANFCLPKTDTPAQLAQQLTSIHKILQRP
jgi:CheY-like chemotaxis protein